MNRTVAFLVLPLLSCVEEVDVLIGGNTEIGDILVVEALLTDELKFHEVTLSRLDTVQDLEIDSLFNPFMPVLDRDRDRVPYVENAVVTIEDSNGATFEFIAVDAGRYLSVNRFAAQPGLEYRLRISTNTNAFTSEAMQIEGSSDLENIYTRPMVSDTGVEGVGIFIDNQSGTGTTGSVRFAYEETFKIIAPRWVPLKYELTDYDPCALPVVIYNLERVPREEEARVCFRTESSNTILLNDTGLADTGLEGFMVRFISKENYIIANRYSIEIQQLTTSPEAFGFYEQLRNFSQSESVFSQVQPGVLQGNITSETGSTVIGFFEVASQSKRRLFFNFEDVFPDEPQPDYPIDCSLRSSPESHISFCFTGENTDDCPQSVIEQVDLDLITYFSTNDLDLGLCPGPDIYVVKPCGDCSVWGSSVAPEFWEE
ncbi:MAG: DUF4249 family protein [Bacteroidota bacterium]